MAEKKVATKKNTKREVKKKAGPTKKAVAAKTARAPEVTGDPVVVRSLYKDALVSPQKARLVADMIRGKRVKKAQDMLRLTTKKSAKIIKKTLDSAVANAEHNHDLDSATLYVSKVMIDEGVKLKRFRIVSRGRAHGYVRRRSHILVELSQKQ